MATPATPDLTDAQKAAILDRIVDTLNANKEWDLDVYDEAVGHITDAGYEFGSADDAEDD
jgi:hypothetical protein